MPELPEVEVIRAQLQTHILGSRITTLHVHRADIVRCGLAHRRWYHQARITDLRRYGKCLVLTCEKTEGTRYIVAELGMTGLFLFPAASRGYEKHIHSSLTLEHASHGMLHYWNPRRFGRLYFLNQEELTTFIAQRFGPDALTFEATAFHTLLRSSKRRIATVLLDQRAIAGLGNIYVNETLYDAGIHPLTRAHRISRQAHGKLHQAIQRILRAATADGGSSIRDFRAPDGTRGHFQERHAVYGRTDSACRRGCPTPIRRLVAARSAFFCPTCQRRF